MIKAFIHNRIHHHFDLIYSEIHIILSFILLGSFLQDEQMNSEWQRWGGYVIQIEML